MKFTSRRTCSLVTFAVAIIVTLLIINKTSWPRTKFSTSVEIISLQDDSTDSPFDLFQGSFLSTPASPAHVTAARKDVDKAVRQAAGEELEMNSGKQLDRMFLCVICCGEERLNETMTALKSAVMFSSSPLTLLVFTQLQHFAVFINMRESWPASEQRRVLLSLQEARYPDTVVEDKWRGLFKQCASLRLFLPTLLPSTEVVLYIDTDVLFVSSVEDAWRHLAAMNSTQLAAVAPEHQDSAAGWYNRFAKHPYYGKLGINSGVMLMNLHRMRAFSWSDYIIPLKEQYEQHIRWGDQDLINILFHFHPELVYEWDCSNNYRPDHCMYGSACAAAESTGVRMLHANRRAAATDKFPPFRDIYSAIAKFTVGRDDLYRDLYRPLQKQLGVPTGSRCGLKPSVFLKQLERYARRNAAV